MELFKTLSAALGLYERNFKIMHWKAVGRRFDDVHAKSQYFAELMAEISDTIAELGIMVGENPVNCDILMEVLSEADCDFGVISPEMDVDYDQFYTYTYDMLSCLHKLLLNLRDHELFQTDPGLASIFDDKLGKVAFELRYLHPRRLTKEEAPEGAEEPEGNE